MVHTPNPQIFQNALDTHNLHHDDRHPPLGERRPRHRRLARTPADGVRKALGVVVVDDMHGRRGDGCVVGGLVVLVFE